MVKPKLIKITVYIYYNVNVTRFIKWRLQISHFCSALSALSSVLWRKNAHLKQSFKILKSKNF